MKDLQDPDHPKVQNPLLEAQNRQENLLVRVLAHQEEIQNHQENLQEEVLDHPEEIQNHQENLQEEVPDLLQILDI